MRYRTHLGRGLDPDNKWNRAIAIISLLAGLTGAALTITLDRDLWLAIQAGGTTFLAWALGRELDPDRQVTAILAAVAGGAWALAGGPTALLPMAGLLLASRLVINTIGLRPLDTDLWLVALVAGVISFTPLGWVMGFVVAVGIYVDERMAEEHNRLAIYAAIGAAAVSSGVATLTGAVPETMSSLHPLMAASLGVLGLVSVGREPPRPVSYIDARGDRFLRQDRLWAARALAGLAVFVGAILSAGHAPLVIPMAFTLCIALVSSEVERIRRPLR